MTSLIERLRNRAKWDTMTSELHHKSHIDWEAADALEEKDREVASLRDCLKDREKVGDEYWSEIERLRSELEATNRRLSAAEYDIAKSRML